MNSDLINISKAEIRKYFNKDGQDYHCLKHSVQVHDAAVTISKVEGIDEKEVFLLQLAALYHDVGYAERPDGHEEVSAREAEKFLLQNNASEEDILTVKNIILATRINANPTTKLEKIIKDADLSHLGQSNYNEVTQKLRREKKEMFKIEQSDKDWLQENIDFLENHKWHTAGAKKLYNKTKKQNLKQQKKELSKILKDEKAQIPEKGIETMYRVALRNHNQLSKIADNKANIMLSITTIMMSLILSSLAPKIDNNEKLLIPTIIIVLVCLVTMIFSILATRPKVSSMPYSRESLVGGKINILFFGNFFNIPLQEFEWGMKQLMKDKDLLYSSLSKDLYFLGIVLAKKYRLLQYAYGVFMFGLILSTFAFIWAFIQ